MTMDCRFDPADPPSDGTFYINVWTHTCPVTTHGDCLPVTLDVSWGDGSSSTAHPMWATMNTGFDHTYSSPGSYDVTVTAQNHNGMGTCQIGTNFTW
jgi:PKD domain